MLLIAFLCFTLVLLGCFAAPTTTVANAEPGATTRLPDPAPSSS